MCFDDRNTLSRGRAAVPWILLRTLGVPDALPLVRLRLPRRPDLGRELADLLLVRPLDDDVRPFLVGHLDGDPFGGFEPDLVGVPDRQDDRLAIHPGLVAQPFDFQLLLVPGRDPDDHVVDQGPGQPVQGPVLPVVVRPGDGDDLARGVELHVHVGVISKFQLALLPLDADLPVLDLDLDVGRDRDRLLTHTRHGHTSGSSGFASARRLRRCTTGNPRQ
jgi:hypothetical protein